MIRRRKKKKKKNTSNYDAVQQSNDILSTKKNHQSKNILRFPKESANQSHVREAHRKAGTFTEAKFA